MKNNSKNYKHDLVEYSNYMLGKRKVVMNYRLFRESEHSWNVRESFVEPP